MPPLYNCIVNQYVKVWQVNLEGANYLPPTLEGGHKRTHVVLTDIGKFFLML